MARTAITPVLNYVKQAGTLLEDFETLAEWTPGGDAGGALDIDTSIKKTGSSSLKFTAPGGGGYFGTKIISKKFNTSGVFTLWVYVPTVETITNFYSIGLYLASTTNFSKYYLYNKNYQWHLGWNKIIINKSEFTTGNGESWNNTMVRIRIRANADPGTPVIVYIDNLSYGEITKPKLIVIFDDGWASQYTEGFDYMQTKGLKGTLYLIASKIGTDGYCTKSQLSEMYDAGWDLSTHGSINLTTLAEAEIEADIIANRKYLIDNNFTRNDCHLHYAYPNGKYNQDVIDILTNLGFKTARNIVDRVQTHEIGEPLNITRQGVYNTTSLATAKSYIDRAIANGGATLLNFHKLVETATVDTEWSISNFQALIDYIKLHQNQGELDVVTISEWYNGLSDSFPRQSATRTLATNRVEATNRKSV